MVKKRLKNRGKRQEVENKLKMKNKQRNDAKYDNMLNEEQEQQKNGDRNITQKEE